MPFSSFRRVAFVGLTLFVVSGCAVSAAEFPAGQDFNDRALPASERIFKPAFEGNNLIFFANAYGDRTTGEHGTFGRFPPNFETPPHIHSEGYRAVVLAGEMTNPFEGEKDPAVMGPGSFWAVKGGSVHTTACVSDIPCEFFMYSQKPFDFQPASGRAHSH